jgi:hypothetical protein
VRVFQADTLMTVQARVAAGVLALGERDASTR